MATGRSLAGVVAGLLAAAGIMVLVGAASAEVQLEVSAKHEKDSVKIKVTCENDCDGAPSSATSKDSKVECKIEGFKTTVTVNCARSGDPSDGSISFYASPNCSGDSVARWDILVPLVVACDEAFPDAIKGRLDDN